MKTGKVKFFMDDKAFGFITQDSGEKDIFVHKNDCIETLRKGDRVTYEVGTSKKGDCAKNVRVDYNK